MLYTGVSVQYAAAIWCGLADHHKYNRNQRNIALINANWRDLLLPEFKKSWQKVKH